MPSKSPEVWRRDVEETRRLLPWGKLLSVSVVATVREGWGDEDVANDYANCARWAVESGADAVETNFSCPNVSTCDGQIYQSPQAAAAIARTVRDAVGSVPYIVKIGHVRSESEAAALVEALGPHVDALAMTNSVAATVVTVDNQRLFDGEKRGICGDAILQASVAQTIMFSKLIKKHDLDLQIIGVGGASHAGDVRSYLDAGAHAVHVATAAMVDPMVGVRMREGLL
jgi:dihydroorotate dehydrogenase